jgi:predicted nucleotidyltransferase
MEDAGTLDSLRDVLLRQPDIALACVFGSFARGRQTATSDIDVAVAAQEPLDARRRLALHDAIASATGRAVDLVDLHCAGPLVLTQALTKGKRIVKRDTGVLARLIVKMWYMNADLMPLVRMIQDARRKRFLHGDSQWPESPTGCSTATRSSP